MPIRLSVLAVVAGLAVAAAPASASTLTGRVSGPKQPKAGRGFTAVRAVHARTLVIADVAEVRSHRYRLKVPAGSYWLLTATTPLRGRAGVDVLAGKVAVRKGKRKSVPVTTRGRKTRRPRLPRMPSARAAFVTVKYPAVWVQHFTVTGGSKELGALRKGLADMLITDLGPPLQAACAGRLVEREKLGVLLGEQILNNPGKLPSTARMIGHNREVSGNLKVDGATTTLTVNVTNVVTGTTRSVTRSAATDRFFELETSVVQEVVRLICGDKPPRHYSGQASGSVSGSDGASYQTLSWNGSVRLKYSGDLLPASGGDPPGEYAHYRPESGSIHVIMDGVQDGECPYHGVADVTIVPPPLGGQDTRVQQGVDEPTYSLQANFPEDTPPMSVTTTGPSYCGGGTTSPYPLAGRVYMGTVMSRRSSSSTLVGDAIVPMGAVTIKWAWSLAPEA